MPAPILARANQKVIHRLRSMLDFFMGSAKGVPHQLTAILRQLSAGGSMPIASFMGVAVGDLRR